eukprot:jgi/Botrbrau1/19956/Bobra.0059s0072.1
MQAELLGGCDFSRCRVQRNLRGVQQDGWIAALHPALTAASVKKVRRHIGRLVELTQAVASERPVESALDDMAVPILNGNVEGSLQWKEQLSRPEEDSNFWSRRNTVPDNRTVLDYTYVVPKDYLSVPELWEVIRAEAKEFAEVEPLLGSQVHTQILVHTSFAKAMAHMLGNKLASSTILGTQLVTLIKEVYTAEPGLLDACAADMQAVKERDPACKTSAHCFLNFKGFQAIQAYRVSHWLWLHGRKALALTLQSRVSEVFQVDIHPAATLGWAFMMDHATGVVIGETATVGHNVSILHQVTLGGSGTGRGWRHPTIGHGVLLGAGVCVLGPVTVGDGTKVGAGSVVVTDLPAHCVAVGVPARVIKRNVQKEPCKDMNFVDDFILDYQI